MPLRRRHLLAVAALLSVSAGGVVRALGAEATPYLTAAQLDLVPFLPQPPAAGSAVDTAEMQEVVVMQATRTEERAAQSKADSDEAFATVYGGLLGALMHGAYDPSRLPRTELLFARLGTSEDETVDPVKKVFARPRPFQANPNVHPSAVISRSGSYPSGHATRATLMAIALIAMLPEHRAGIWARADDYAESRVIGGVHYRSDLAAGRLAGEAMAGAIFADAAFRADLAAARVELRAAVGL